MRSLLVVFLLLCTQEIVPQSSREARSVNIPLTDSPLSMLTFDPVTSTLSRYVHSLCSSIGCEVQDTQQRIEEWIEQYISNGLLYSFASNGDGEAEDAENYHHEDIFDGDENYFSHLEGGDKDTAWLLQSDSLTKQRYKAVKKEAMLLQEGRALPRPYCNQSMSVLQNHADCKFARIAAQFNINDTPIVLHNSSLEDWSAYLEFGEQLFNVQLYTHAQGWIYHLLRNMDKHFNISEHPIDRYHELMIRGSLMIAEIAKIKGDWEVSFLYSLRMLRSHEMISSSQQQAMVIMGAPQSVPIDNDFRLFVFRLRALLSVPPTPPPQSEALVERRNMIEDLYFLMQLAAEGNVHIPLSKLSSEISATPFNLAHQGLNDHFLQITLAQLFQTLCPELMYISPNISPEHEQIQWQKNNDQAADSSKDPVILKIGFVSSHFFDHSIGRILIETILYLKETRLNRDGFDHRFQVLVYFIDQRMGRNLDVAISGTKVSVYGRPSFEDSLTQIFRDRLGKDFIRVPDNAYTLQMILTEARLDFIMFADLGMDFASYQVAFSRVATYQAAWWGHPITSGLDSIDYFISLDDELPDAATKHYSEQLVRMEHINTVALGPQPVDIKRIPPNVISSEQLGIPAGSRFCMILGRLFKLHPEFDYVIILLLERLALADAHQQRDHEAESVPSTYLVLVAESVFELNRIIFERLRGVIVEHNEKVDKEERSLSADKMEQEMLKRIRIISYDHYHNALSQSRVVLDTFPYGGCITSHDALHASIPVVTMPAVYIRGRFTLSMYRQMEMMHLVARNQTHYVDLVMQLMFDDAYWQQQSHLIAVRFNELKSRNRRVAEEWTQFLLNLFS